ncbi:hypothetical protein D4764_15G0007250 [Takifugu flavidus]|uniref:Uncharacterized protein n=1 Tax=Takifugu flavidus TaxID=433684 RepID=A0A5C6P3J9_9TELE|nr:hypothetical protein D4764_15G0007250 [Takifugu flavidus]
MEGEKEKEEENTLVGPTWWNERHQKYSDNFGGHAKFQRKSCCWDPCEHLVDSGFLSCESITEADHQRNWYVVVWDNTLSASGAAPPTMLCISEPPQKGSWCWAYERQPFVCTPLVQAVEEPCGEIDMGAIQGWMRRSRHFFPRRLAREDGACDVDEALWADPAVRQHAA